MCHKRCVDYVRAIPSTYSTLVPLMTNILTQNFTAHVRLLNETKHTKYVLQDGIIAYLEFESVSGGYALTLGVTDGITDDTGKDFDIEFPELVTLNHLKEASFLDSISLLDVVKAMIEDRDPSPMDSFNKGLAAGFSKNVEVVFSDYGDDLEFVVTSGQYSTSIRVHRSQVPAWAFARD